MDSEIVKWKKNRGRFSRKNEQRFTGDGNGDRRPVGDYTIMVACEMDLPRAYVCDFEEYQNGNMEDAEIHVYIGLYELMIYDDLLGFTEVYWGYGVFCWHARTFWIIAQLYSGAGRPALFAGSFPNGVQMHDKRMNEQIMNNPPFFF